MIEIHPLTGIGEICAGASLAALLGDALDALGLMPFAAGDVLVVTQKIVSKAEGRMVDLSGIVPSAEATRLAEVTGKDRRFVELVLGEATGVVRAAPNVLITRHRSGHIMANSGVDRSNLGVAGDHALLLPEDADASARRLRAELVVPAVLISDSFGRPWRMGVAGFAIGAAGLPALVDRRGDSDRDGRTLEVTQIALGDLLASAAALVTGEGAEGIPAALIRGMILPDGSSPASVLIRPEPEDLFR